MAERKGNMSTPYRERGGFTGSQEPLFIANEKEYTGSAFRSKLSSEKYAKIFKHGFR